VHRSGNRWLCASAHNTDVVPSTGTSAADHGGLLGLNYPSDQLS